MGGFHLEHSFWEPGHHTARKPNTPVLRPMGTRTKACVCVAVLGACSAGSQPWVCAILEPDPQTESTHPAMAV